VRSNHGVLHRFIVHAAAIMGHPAEPLP
jgi:hypothetical protein